MPPDNRLHELTAREREVLDLVRLGLTNEEIAGRLGITEAGAKYHVSQILSKLGVSTREEAATVALAPRRRWWAALPLAAKAAGVAVMVAAVAGLGVLAWGVLRTSGSGEEGDRSTDNKPPTVPEMAASKIVFAATHDVDFDIYTINIDGSGLTNITNDPRAPDFFPAWSPDRGHIAYFSFQYRTVTAAPNDPKEATTVQERYLYIVDANGSGNTRLTGSVPQLHDTNPPAWSPDGSRVAIESEHEGTGEVFIINVDGSGLRNISNHPAYDSGPTWSSDGSRIAFTSNRDGVDEIYVAAVDGSGTTRLTTAGGRSPAWSPDGSRIAFFSERDGNSELYVMNSDGSAQVNLSAHPAPDFSAPVGHLPPLWAVDSQRIAFLSARDGSTKVHIANAGSSVVTRLTNNGADESLASWSPDGGDFILWAGGSLYSVNTSGEGEPQLILDLDATLLPSSER